MLQQRLAKQNKSEVVENITTLGFSKFASEATFQSYKGVDVKNFGRLSDLILKKLKVNNATKSEVKEYLSMVPQQKVEEWNMFRTLFSLENSTNATYLCLMTYLNSNNKLNVHMVQMSQNFELAQDVLVIRNSYTTDDGKFSYQQDQIEHVPH
jgi:hypothetical protein